jgi:hypothetical protein
VSTTVGLENEYGPTEIINAYTLKITSFKARIRIGGAFSYGEILTIRFRLELIDNAIMTGVTKSFNQTSALWLGDEDLFELSPSENVIWAILVDAKTNSKSTNTSVQIDIYGTTA